jgi:methionyl-tRNA formyltransferase
MPMRLVFAGTPPFAAVALEALLAAGHEIVLVLTQPDRPAGRGKTLRSSEVKALALARGLALAQPPSLRDGATVATLQRARPDAIVVAAYGLILPRDVLDIPRRGCINIHASILPRWRGAAPIQRAILSGDAETGVSIMVMEAGLDTGPVIAVHRVAIAPDDTGGSLTEKVTRLGAEAIVEALAALEAGTARPVPQPETGATYATKIDKSEASIDWAASPDAIDRQVRAFDPVPGAATLIGGEVLKLFRPAPVAGPAAAPGTVVAVGSDRLIVACGQGALAVRELQRAGGRRLTVSEFVRGFPLRSGMRLGA